MRLASTTDLKIFLEKTDSDHDLLLGLILDSISSSIESYTSRKFEKVSRTEYFNAGGDIFQLRAFPIDSAIATVVVVDSTTQTVNDDYYIYYDEGYIEFPSYTTKTDPKEVVITYTGGYSWTVGSGRINVPDDLMFATLFQAAYVFRNRKNLGMASLSLPDGSITVNNQDEFLPQVVAVLDRYKI